MSPETVAALIAGGGFGLSVLGSVYISGRRDGQVELRLTMLERAQEKLATKEQVTTLEATQEKLATKEQVAGLKEDVAEIRGMFRMSLREPSS